MNYNRFSPLLVSVPNYRRTIKTMENTLLMKWEGCKPIIAINSISVPD